MILRESITRKKSIECRSKKDFHKSCNGVVIYSYGARVIEKKCQCKCHKEKK